MMESSFSLPNRDSPAAVSASKTPGAGLGAKGLGPGWTGGGRVDSFRISLMELIRFRITALSFASWIGLGVGASTTSVALAEPPASSAPGATGADPSTVLATFRGGAITVADMEQAVAQKLRPTRLEIAEPGGRERFLEELIRHDLLALEAERRGYGDHPRVVEAAQRKSVEKLLDEKMVVDPASVTDDEIAKYYEEHSDRWNRPEMRRARHVQLATLEAAQEVLRLAKAGGANELAKLARERSTDERTRRQSGELGYFDREGKAKVGDLTIDPAIAAAVFALQGRDAIAPQPVRTKDGYSVVMLVGELPKVAISARDARETIREELTNERRDKMLKELMAKLEAEVPTEVHPELLPAIRLPEASIGDRPQGFPVAPPDPRAPPKLVKPDGF